VIVGDTNGVRHGRELISICVEKFLMALLSTHLCPFAICLIDEIVDVTEVADLLGRQFGIPGQVQLERFWYSRSHDGDVAEDVRTVEQTTYLVEGTNLLYRPGAENGEEPRDVKATSESFRNERVVLFRQRTRRIRRMTYRNWRDRFSEQLCESRCFVWRYSTSTVNPSCLLYDQAHRDTNAVARYREGVRSAYEISFCEECARYAQMMCQRQIWIASGHDQEL
jgi:hypothetical protein